MPRIKNASVQRDAHIMTLRLLICGLFVVIGFMWFGWNNAPSTLRINVPPDLSRGYSGKLNDVPKASVYSFSYYIFQQLNKWDGRKEHYKERIETLSAYFTPTFKTNRMMDYDKRRRQGELGRERTVSESAGSGYVDNRVEIETSSSWIIYLDLNIRESISGEIVKDIVMRYPLRVIRYDVDPETNQWGLAIDGFASAPMRVVSKKSN